MIKTNLWYRLTSFFSITLKTAQPPQSYKFKFNSIIEEIRISASQLNNLVLKVLKGKFRESCSLLNNFIKFVNSQTNLCHFWYYTFYILGTNKECIKPQVYTYGTPVAAGGRRWCGSRLRGSAPREPDLGGFQPSAAGSGHPRGCRSAPRTWSRPTAC